MRLTASLPGAELTGGTEERMREHGLSCGAWSRILDSLTADAAALGYPGW